MNETTPPTGGQQPPFGAGFFTWLRGLGISRGGQRWFAGVASGIAQRANIDPIIVRGIFVVLALLGGPGILLYLAGWLLLPDIGGRIHLEEVFRGRAGTAAVVTVVAVGIFVVIPTLFRVIGLSFFDSWSLWDAVGVPDWISTTLIVFAWIVAMCAISYFAWQLFLKHGRNVGSASGTASDAASSTASRTADSGVDQPQASPAASTGQSSAIPMPAAAPLTEPGFVSADPPPTTQTSIDDFTQRITEGANRLGEQAGQWGEKVGKQADDWSARYAAHHDARALGVAHTVITLAIAMLAAGGAAIWALGSSADTALLVTASLIGAASVLAVSLIIAGIRGRNTGWVGFLAFCSVVALVSTSVLPWGSRFQPFGEMDIAASGVDSGAVLLAGNTYVDLTPLDGNRVPSELTVWHLAGNSKVMLPEDAPVVVKIYLLAGNLTGPSSTSNGIDGGTTRASGPFLSRTIETHPGSTRASTVSVFMLGGNISVVNRGSEHRTHQGLIDKNQTSEIENELSSLRDEEDALRYELDQPGLSDIRKERLENSLEFTRDEISKLEKEFA